MTMAAVEDEHGRRDPGFAGSAAANTPQSILPVSTTATAADNGTETSCRGAAEKVGELRQSAAGVVDGVGAEVGEEDGVRCID
ncbi:hypothetical protein ACFX16_046830 [Malus domestica]